MSLLKDAIALNNEGVQLLSSGNFSVALASFQGAVAVMKEAAIEHAEIPSSVLRSFRALASPPTSHIGQQQEHEQRPDKIAGLRSDIVFVYARPLLIADTSSISSLEELQDFVLTTSASLVFNFALVWHQQGVVTNSASCLRRAACLYKLTLKSIAFEECECPRQKVLRCLALNNLAFLHFDQYDFKISQGYFELLTNVVMKSNCLETYLSGDEIEELMLNLLHMQTMSNACAACAA